MSTSNEIFYEDRLNINMIENNKSSQKIIKRRLSKKLKTFLEEYFPKSKYKRLTLNPSHNFLLKNNNKEMKIAYERQILFEEIKIYDLIREKTVRLNKIEDLRKIIDKIASEKSYDKHIQRDLIDLKNFGKKDRCSCPDSSFKFQRYIISLNSGSTAHDSSKSSENTEFEGIERALENKEDQVGEKLPKENSDKILNQKHLLNCLSYWRENLFPDNYQSKKYF